jgi:hypothetical protein
LIETLSDGTWTPLQGPLPPNAVSEGESAQAFLDMLDCSSIDSCVSLGFYAIVPPPGSPFDMDIPAGLIETFGIPLAPSFSSVDQATFTGGQDGTFAITASGAPLPGVTEKGKLPKGLHFTKGKGSATIAGTPSSKKSGTYHLEIKASNSVKSNVRQTLTLTVSP